MLCLEVMLLLIAEGGSGRNINKVTVTLSSTRLLWCVRLADHIHNDILSPPLLLIGPQPPDQDRAGDFHLPVIGRAEDSQEGKQFSKPDF